MWLVTKQGKSVRELSAAERAQVLRFVEDDCTNAEKEHASRLLRKIRMDDCWIACDCSKPAPLLNVALLDTGHLSLRNNASSGDHTSDCPLRKQATGSDDRSVKQRDHGISQYQTSDLIALHVEFSKGNGRETSQISRSATSGTDRSQRRRASSFLFTLLEAAGLNQYDPSAPLTLSKQFARLREASTKYRLTHSVPLSSMFETHISKKSLYALSMKLKGANSFGEGRRSGLLFDLVDSVKGRTIKTLDTKDVPFCGSAEKTGKATAPLIALATVTTQQDKSTFYEIKNVATVPALSRTNMLPVFTDNERSALLEIVSLLDWLYKKHGRKVVLRRHFFISDHIIELVGSDRIVQVDLLSDDTLKEDTTAPLHMGVTLALGNESIDSFKKQIAKAFLRDLE